MLSQDPYKSKITAYLNTTQNVSALQFFSPNAFLSGAHLPFYPWGSNRCSYTYMELEYPTSIYFISGCDKFSIIFETIPLYSRSFLQNLSLVLLLHWPGDPTNQILYCIFLTICQVSMVPSMLESHDLIYSLVLWTIIVLSKSRLLTVPTFVLTLAFVNDILTECFVNQIFCTLSVWINK